MFKQKDNKMTTFVNLPAEIFQDLMFPYIHYNSRPLYIDTGVDAKHFGQCFVSADGKQSNTGILINPLGTDDVILEGTPRVRSLIEAAKLRPNKSYYRLLVTCKYFYQNIKKMLEQYEQAIGKAFDDLLADEEGKQDLMKCIKGGLYLESLYAYLCLNPQRIEEVLPMISKTYGTHGTHRIWIKNWYERILKLAEKHIPTQKMDTMLVKITPDVGLSAVNQRVIIAYLRNFRENAFNAKTVVKVGVYAAFAWQIGLIIKKMIIPSER